MPDTRPLLARLLLPRVPWWMAATCNVLSAAAIVLLFLDPGGNLPIAVILIGIAAVALYGTALVLWVRKRG